MEFTRKRCSSPRLAKHEQPTHRLCHVLLTLPPSGGRRAVQSYPQTANAPSSLSHNFPIKLMNYQGVAQLFPSYINKSVQMSVCDLRECICLSCFLANASLAEWTPTESSSCPVPFLFMFRPRRRNHEFIPSNLHKHVIGNNVPMQLCTRKQEFVVLIAKITYESPRN